MILNANPGGLWFYRVLTPLVRIAHPSFSIPCGDGGNSCQNKAARKQAAGNDPALTFFQPICLGNDPAFWVESKAPLMDVWRSVFYGQSPLTDTGRTARQKGEGELE
jgi:hypothetical protein